MHPPVYANLPSQGTLQLSPEAINQFAVVCYDFCISIKAIAEVDGFVIIGNQAIRHDDGGLKEGDKELKALELLPLEDKAPQMLNGGRLPTHFIW